MLRTIKQPAVLSGAGLSEFKQWLGITRTDEDALLLDLLSAAVAMCEAFTGQTPLEQRVEERFPPQRGRYHLASRPVQALVAAESVSVSGTRTTIAASGYRFEVCATGMATFDLQTDLDAQFMAVEIVAGIAPDWASLPGPLRQGIIRLAAHYYRDRDHEGAVQPPASVSALWRPWRITRLT
jgi:uncharacterized phiE125 gp8 family phage protein